MASDQQMKNRPVVISLEGILGSGKSTFLNLIKRRYPEFLIVEEPVNDFQNFKNYNPLDLLKSNALATQCHILFVLKKYYAELLPEFDKHPVVIIERSMISPRIFSEALHNYGKLTSFEHHIFLKVFDEVNTDFPQVQGIFCLKLDKVKCLKRIIKRNRLEELDFVTLRYLYELENAYDRYFHESETPLWLTSNNTEQPELLLKELTKFIDSVR